MPKQELIIGDKQNKRLVIESDGREIVIRYDLTDVAEPGRTQHVDIYLTENVEVVIPKVIDEAQQVIGDNERAVARVELFEGAVRAMLWDETRCTATGDDGMAQIVPLISTCP